MTNELAILIPAYNGGALLRESVESCSNSGALAGRYGILVVDNCSTDGSVDALPSADRNGAPIKVYRNQTNLGRVPNWNRALEIAESEGFRFAAFLFVGDTWVAGEPVAELLRLMEKSAAVMGMAPLLIAQEDGQTRREGARVSIPGDTAVVRSETLLEDVVRTGRLPFAPLQANIYRLIATDPLRFDTRHESALNTDIESTAAWLQHHPGLIAFASRPFLTWKERRGRFLSTQDPWQILLESRVSLQRISDLTGYKVDWKSANAVSLLTACRELSAGRSLRDRLAFLWKVFVYLRECPGGIGIVKTIVFTLRKVFLKQSHLSLQKSAVSPDGLNMGHASHGPVITRCES